MLKSIMELAKDSIVYGLAELLNRALQVILLPLIFIYLNKESFGILDYLFAVKNLLNVLLAYGLSTAIQRFDFYAKDYPKEKVIPTALTIILIIDIVVNAIFLLWGNAVSQALMGGNFGWELFLICATSSLFALRSIPLGILRLRRKSFQYLIISVSYFLIYIGLTYVLISQLNLDFLSFVYGGLIAVLISLLLGLFFIRKDIKLEFSFPLAQEILTFGLSVLTSSIAVILITTINRFFLKLNGTFEDLAIFGMSNRLAIVVGALLVAPFNLAWLPYVQKIYKQDHFQDIVNKIIQIFTGIGVVLTLILSLFGTDILHLLGDTQYKDSIIYVPFFCASFIFQGYYFIASSGLFLHNKKKYYVVISLITSFSSLLLYIILINHLNVLLVSIITMCGSVIMFALGYYYGNLSVKFSQKGFFLMWLSVILVMVFNIVNPTIVESASFGVKSLVVLLNLILALVLFKRKNQNDQKWV